MKFMILPISNQDLMKKNQMQHYIYSLGGGDKRDRIKWDTIIGKVKEGGVFQVNIERNLKQWKRYMQKKNLSMNLVCIMIYSKGI